MGTPATLPPKSGHLLSNSSERLDFAGNNQDCIVNIYFEQLKKQRAARIVEVGLHSTQAGGNIVWIKRACNNRESRSEERRVGKECRSRWSPYQEKKKNRMK